MLFTTTLISYVLNDHLTHLFYPQVKFHQLHHSRDTANT